MALRPHAVGSRIVLFAHSSTSCAPWRGRSKSSMLVEPQARTLWPPSPMDLAIALAAASTAIVFFAWCAFQLDQPKRK